MGSLIFNLLLFASCQLQLKFEALQTSVIKFKVYKYDINLYIITLDLFLDRLYKMKNMCLGKSALI